MKRNKILNTKKLRNEDHKVLCVTLFLSFFVVSISFAQSVEVRKKVIGDVARQEGPPYFAKIAARIKTNFKTEVACSQLDTLLAREQGDMFWMYGCAGLYYSCKSELPQSYKDKVRRAWKLCTPYRGDTDNHFLMYYSSLYLMAQEWDDLSESEWFLGKSSKQITKESKEYLEHWIDETVRYGMSEFDSPRYMYYYITPLVLLAEYVADGKFKTKCEMMLELLLADYAHDYYFGNYVGAHSRVGFDQALDSRKAETASYGQFYFEDSVSLVMPDVAFAAMGKWECPEIIKKIATKKTFPFKSIEEQRVRKVVRGEEDQRVPVKRMLMTKHFALGSMNGGLVSPIQQQSWTLTINTSKENNVVTGLHPYVSASELGKYFPEKPSWQLERIEATKKGYSSEDKFIGGSPYESIHQEGHILYVDYVNVPQDVRYQHCDIIFPKWVREYADHDSALHVGVVFGLDSTTVQICTKSRYSWAGDGNYLRIRIPFVDGKASYTMECFSSQDIADGYQPRSAIMGPPVRSTKYRPRKESQYAFESPYVKKMRGANVVRLLWKNQSRTLDFKANRIIEKK